MNKEMPYILRNFKTTPSLTDAGIKYKDLLNLILLKKKSQKLTIYFQEGIIG